MSPTNKLTKAQQHNGHGQQHDSLDYGFDRHFYLNKEIKETLIEQETVEY